MSNSPDDIYIHPTALVETSDIGGGTRVWAGAHVMAGAVVGGRCNIGDGVFVESGAVIGSGVVVKNGCLIFAGITIEDCAFIGPGVVFTNDRFPRSRYLPAAAARYDDESWLETTRVGYGASLGGGAVITPGVIIGRYATVAAGAVVTRDVPDHGLVAGSPARPWGWECRCGRKLATAVPDRAPSVGTCGCGLSWTTTEIGPAFAP